MCVKRLSAWCPSDNEVMNAAALFDCRTWNLDVSFDISEVQRHLKLLEKVFQCPDVEDDSVMFLQMARWAMHE